MSRQEGKIERKVPQLTPLGTVESVLGRRPVLEKKPTTLSGPYNPIIEMTEHERTAVRDDSLTVLESPVGIGINSSPIFNYAMLLFADIFGENRVFPEELKQESIQQIRGFLTHEFSFASYGGMEFIEEAFFARLILGTRQETDFRLEGLTYSEIPARLKKAKHAEVLGPIALLYAQDLEKRRQDFIKDEARAKKFLEPQYYLKESFDEFGSVSSDERDNTLDEFYRGFIKEFAWTRIMIGDERWEKSMQLTSENWTLIRNLLEDMTDYEERWILAMYATILGAETIGFSKEGKLQLTFAEEEREEEGDENLPEMVEFNKYE